jgi:hypothetical protein
MQIGTAKYGIRDQDGAFSPEGAKETAKLVKAFEIKLSQGAKPGKGGLLPGTKVTDEIAAIRGIPAHHDSISPNRHRDIGNVDELLDKIAYMALCAGADFVNTARGFMFTPGCSCGLRHARQLKRDHVRIVETAGKSVALSILYLYPETPSL